MPLAYAAEKTEAISSLAPVLKNTMPAIVNVAVQGYLPSETLPPGAAGEDEAKTTNNNHNIYLKKVGNLKALVLELLLIQLKESSLQMITSSVMPTLSRLLYKMVDD